MQMNLKKVENALVAPPEVKTTLAELLTDMPGGFFVYHADGNEELVYANDACLRIFGCDTLEQFKELTGFTFPGMLHEDDVKRVEDSIKDQIAHDIHNMDYVEYRIVTYDGSIRWIEDYGHFVETDTGDYFYVFINDATDKLRDRMEELEHVNAELKEAYSRETEHRRLLHAALQQANAANVAKTTFLNSMSHDIRTLLNAVTGYSTLIADHLDDPESVQDFANKITEASAQLLDVVVETLEVSRFEAGRNQLVEEDCSLKGILSEVDDRFAPRAAKRGVAFKAECVNVEHDEIISDPQRIKQIIDQLADNAIKYTDPGGEVDVRIEELAAIDAGLARFKISVSDTGDGMHQDFIDHMFDPFAREETTTESGITGTGLGLTIVKHSVDLLSAAMEVDTEEGEGTTVSIVFGAKISGGRKKPDVKLPDSLNLEDLNVLLVEDNELNREIALCMLADNGANVVYAVDGEQAVEMVQKSASGDIDIILMDIQLPLMNGYDATRTIRGLEDHDLANIPIIAVTSDAFPEDRKKAISAGMNGHIAKPLTIESLRSAINNIA